MEGEPPPLMQVMLDHNSMVVCVIERERDVGGGHRRLTGSLVKAETRSLDQRSHRGFV